MARLDNVEDPTFVGKRIRAAEVRLISHTGEQMGIVAIATALALADEAGLDLVAISPDATPPVCKIMDFSKYKYELAQKAKEAKRHQAHVVVKEIRFGVNIENHDYETKKNHIMKFLKDGDKVRVTVQFKGREQSHPELGSRLLAKLSADVTGFGFVEFAPKKEGKSMTMVLGPLIKKSPHSNTVTNARSRKN